MAAVVRGRNVFVVVAVIVVSWISVGGAHFVRLEESQATIDPSVSTDFDAFREYFAKRLNVSASDLDNQAVRDYYYKNIYNKGVPDLEPTIADLGSVLCAMCQEMTDPVKRSECINKYCIDQTA